MAKFKTKFLSVTQEQFDRLDDEQNFKIKDQVNSFKSDKGGAYHCVNCSRRVFDSDCRVGPLGLQVLTFAKSENGTTVTVPEKNNGRFRDLVKCSRCKHPLGVRGTSENTQNEKCYLVKQETIKFRYKTFL